MTHEEWQAYLSEIFPNEILGFKRPAEPVPQDLDFSTEFKQFIAKDPVVYTLINALIRQVMSNDNLLKQWTDQLFTQISKEDFKIVTETVKGMMSPDMLKKLNGISVGANNYTHPGNHPAIMITEDAAHRFVSDTEKGTWNSKASAAVVSTTANGLCPQRNGNTASYLRGDGTWATPPGTYTHPGNHPATMIAEDAAHRFVSDTEKGTWNGKAGTAVATQSANGLMPAADKKKLDGVAAGANAYSHPANHPASMITQDSSNRFVSDAEKGVWNGKAPIANPGLTGTPTAPTPASNDNSTRIATTAFVLALINGLKGSGDFGDKVVAQSLGANGYRKYASGFMIQWGDHLGVDANPIVFPVSFSRLFGVIPSSRNQTLAGVQSSAGTACVRVYTYSNTQFTCRVAQTNNLPGTATDMSFHWIALGV